MTQTANATGQNEHDLPTTSNPGVDQFPISGVEPVQDHNALYALKIRHVRRDPIGNVFQYRSYQWFVDLDNLPRIPWWARPFAQFRAKDHLAAPNKHSGSGTGTLVTQVQAFNATKTNTIADNVRAQLREYGIDAGGPIYMLANAAVLGWVFNPVSFFWCYHSAPRGSEAHNRKAQHDEGKGDGANRKNNPLRDGPKNSNLACILAEVHNTYGERHTYLLEPDEHSHAATDKNFYVSPFHPVDGRYTMTLPEPGERLTISITLHRDDAKPFTATMTGNRLPVTWRNIARLLTAIPLAPLRVLAQIHYQGVKLWLRRLAVQPRPTPPRQPISAPRKENL